MLATFRKKLEHAEGRSEFVVAVICDIRGFSAFSTSHESPDTAMFIKRFYATLLDDYFTQAVFAKPTGDGLLLIFRYAETNLCAVSEYVLSTCFKVVEDFPLMFTNDPMINFPTPSRVGFGISRGPSCCLFSGRTILDYSGQLLNLAARLNDLARPQGIVIAGSYRLDVIPPSLRARFATSAVYIRGIAESIPVEVFYSQPDVIIPGYALHPTAEVQWTLVEHSFTIAELMRLGETFQLRLPSEPASARQTKMFAEWLNPKMAGYSKQREYDYYEVRTVATGPYVVFKLGPAKEIVKQEKLTRSKHLTFRFEFQPKSPIKGEKKTTQPIPGGATKNSAATKPPD